MIREKESAIRGRKLAVVINDRESEARTPAQPLYVIPADARDDLRAMPPLPYLRTGEADLTRIAPGRPQASGQVIEVVGRILDEDLRPVRGAFMEVWNANAAGRYSHVIDETRTQAPLDPNFYGFGRIMADDDGRYRLRTIKPGAYLARADIGWYRPPHVHFSLLGGGVRLVTQMYFPNEPLNQKDYIHMTIPEAERERAIGKTIQSESGSLQLRFDIIVRGRFQTPTEIGGR